MAGGLLITGLLIGFLRSIWPIFGRVPSAARWVLMELGLLIFMAGVGLNAGGGIVEIVQTGGDQTAGGGHCRHVGASTRWLFFQSQDLQADSRRSTWRRHRFNDLWCSPECGHRTSPRATHLRWDTPALMPLLT